MGILFDKKKGAIYFAIFMSSQGMLNAQTQLFEECINPFVLNITGGSKSINYLTFDWSVGSTIQLTAIAPNFSWMLSFGFLQNDYNKLLLFKTRDSFGLSIKVGPNPFSDYLIIRCNQDGIIITGLQLMDLFGNVLFQSNQIQTGINYYNQLHLNKLNNPACVLVVYYTISNEFSSSRKYKLLQN